MADGGTSLSESLILIKDNVEQAWHGYDNRCSHRFNAQLEHHLGHLCGTTSANERFVTYRRLKLSIEVRALSMDLRK